jgi:hypothetical protein
MIPLRNTAATITATVITITVSTATATWLRTASRTRNLSAGQLIKTMLDFHPHRALDQTARRARSSV